MGGGAVWHRLIPRYSDRTGERRNIAALTLLAAAVGIAVSGLVAPVLAIIALCVAAVGVIAVQPVFWTMPTQLLSGTALAAGLALLTCLAPSVVFWRRSCACRPKRCSPAAPPDC